MKILCFIDSLGSGGAQRQLVGLAAMLKEKKYDIKVITYHNDMFFLPYLQSQKVEYQWVENANNRVTRIYYTYKELKKYSPDLLISYLDTPNIITCICRMLGLKFKLLVSERNTTQKLTLHERVKFFFFNWADYIVPNSYSQELFIRKRYPNLSNKVFTITNFVDIDYFLPIEHKRNSVPTIMIAASIWPSKNTLGFIKALELLINNDAIFQVYWFGKSAANQDYFHLCKEEISKRGLDGYIKLLDKTNNIKNKYQKADFFCLPSFYEGTPNVICEAISCGLPIICSDVCDNSIYVQEGLNGFLFDPKSPQSIAEKLHKALQLSDVFYLKFREKSRLNAEQKLSKLVFIDNYLKLINRLN